MYDLGRLLSTFGMQQWHQHTIRKLPTPASIAGSKDKDEAMQELVRSAEEHAAAAQRRLDEKLAARLMLLAGTSGEGSIDGASLSPQTLLGTT